MYHYVAYPCIKPKVCSVPPGSHYFYFLLPSYFPLPFSPNFPPSAACAVLSERRRRPETQDGDRMYKLPDTLTQTVSKGVCVRVREKE